MPPQVRPLEDIQDRPSVELTADEIAAIEAREFAIVNIQVAINAALRAKRLMPASLTRMTGLSYKAVDSVISDTDLTQVRNLVSILHSLGLSLKVTEAE